MRYLACPGKFCGKSCGAIKVWRNDQNLQRNRSRACILEPCEFQKWVQFWDAFELFSNCFEAAWKLAGASGKIRTALRDWIASVWVMLTLAECIWLVCKVWAGKGMKIGKESHVPFVWKDSAARREGEQSLQALRAVTMVDGWPRACKYLLENLTKVSISFVPTIGICWELSRIQKKCVAFEWDT